MFRLVRIRVIIMKIKRYDFSMRALSATTIFILCLSLLTSLIGCATPRDLSIGHTLAAKNLTEEKSQHDEAIKKAKQSIVLDPSYAPGWYWLGVAYYRKVQYDEAIQAFRKVIELKTSGPQYQSSYDFLGWSYFNKGNYENAISHFNNSLELKPNDHSSLQGRAYCYSYTDNYERSIEDFDSALRLKPQDWSSFQGRAWSYYHIGNYERAIKDFNTARENIEPNNKSGLRKIFRGKAFSYLGLGDVETAVNLIKNAKAALDYDTSYDLSLIYYVIGDKEKAWEYRGGKGMIGVEVKDYKKGTVAGVEVVRTAEGGPAEKAGMLTGDVITKLDGMDIVEVRDVVKKAIRLAPGTTAMVRILREGLQKELMLKVTSAEALMETAHIIAPIIAKKGSKPTKKVVKVSPKEAYASEKLPPLRLDTYAVIIGIDYKDRADIPNLKFPSQDAKKVYDILTDPRYGGVPKENATLLLNEGATRNKMIAALRKIKTWDGYIYVYFSGHGAPKTKGNNLIDAFLVPSDVIITDPETLDDTSIKLSYLQNIVDSSQAKGVMVAIDSCFTGGGKSIVPKGGKPLVGVLVSPELIKPKGTGRVIITSSAINQQSWEDDTELKGGIFSYYLLEGLKGKAGKDIWVKVDELTGYIKENVPRAARKLKGIEQDPQISGKGDFAVTRNWARAKVMDIEIAKSRLKSAFEKEYITAEQLNRALDELKTPKRSKTLEAFLKGKLEAKRFGGLY